MARPTTREEFKQYCLRKLGAPVTQINVADEQVEDRIDESLSYYWDYHFDGSSKVYYKHLVTQQSKDDGYITLPENINGAVRIFNPNQAVLQSSDIFNVRYQIALNELFTLTSISLVPYYMAMEHLALIQEILVGEVPIRFTRHKNRLYVDTNWDRIREGTFILVEAYEVIDPDVYIDVWKDRWLQSYCTEKIKYQWGTNLTKFIDMPMPGGQRFNGDRILSDAEAAIRKLEDEMLVSYSLPPVDMIG